MLYSDQNDETLVMLTLAGEQRAYEVLVVRHENAVIAAANAVVHNRHLAEDAAQDAFITAWMKLNILREPRKYASWVCRIAANCAKNMVMRFHTYLSMDDLENIISKDEQNADPQELYVSSEEKNELHESISSLPEKVRQIVCMHYFQDLSIAEIADKMRISAGTVKWQLHDGRKRIRKELCAMNEEINDTLVQRVMKKVEELKLWQMKNSKQGFASAYKDVLAEVEKLPESVDKYHALADVLMRGWWWLPGDKNDALFARICEAAELGKNDEVMQFIVGREDEKLSGQAKIEFILQKQIPRLEKGGFPKSLAHEWYWLGRTYFDNNESEKGFEAYDKVLSVANKSDLYYAGALASTELQKRYVSHFKDVYVRHYNLVAGGTEYRMLDGRLCRWNTTWDWKGNISSADLDADDIFYNATRCDGRFTVDGLKVGETYIGSDGTTLKFAADGEIVETACGKFDDCQLWVIVKDNEIYNTYYKSGVGIIKQERICDGITETRVLKSYKVGDGSGLIPCAEGNEWEYAADYNPEAMKQDCRVVVCYADDRKVIMSQIHSIERLQYDENLWVDMIQQVRNDYWVEVDGNEKLNDVCHAMERAEALAKSPMEKAHTKAACSVARRILETDPDFNPNYTARGYWNFFQRRMTGVRDGMIKSYYNYRWSFEWKKSGGTIAEQSLFYNDVYGILHDALNCLWNEKWEAGVAYTEEFIQYGSEVKTKVRCEDAGTITTAAGVFDNCLKLSLDIDGYKNGLSYRAGKKEYYFAPSVGIVRFVSGYCQDNLHVVYELSSYEGNGEGYMPLKDGMVRRYEALDLTDGFVGSAEYAYVADANGNIVIFEDRCGIQKRIEDITQYGFIKGEVMEEELWNQQKYDESRIRHDVNNFNILSHFLGRYARTWAKPERSVAWHKHKMEILEFLGDGKGVPRAWLGEYARSCFHAAAALFGAEHMEEGYEYLDRAFELYSKWLEIPDGEALEVGNEMIYGGIKVIKGKGMIELPDGTREPIQYSYLLEPSSGDMYYGMTAQSGWEWFNGVRDDERFKKAIDRAKKLMEDMKKQSLIPV